MVPLVLVGLIVLAVAMAVLAYYVFYRVIKAAVRNGIDESRVATSVLDILAIEFLSDPDEPGES